MWGKNHKLYKLMSQAYMQKHIKYVHIEYSKKNHLCTYIHKCIDLCISNANFDQNRTSS